MEADRAGRKGEESPHALENRRGPSRRKVKIRRTPESVPPVPRSSVA
jgi:hypothetical protein